MTTVNYLAVIVSAIIYMAIEALWHSSRAVARTFYFVKIGSQVTVITGIMMGLLVWLDSSQRQLLGQSFGNQSRVSRIFLTAPTRYLISDHGRNNR